MWKASPKTLDGTDNDVSRHVIVCDVLDQAVVLQNQQLVLKLWVVVEIIRKFVPSSPVTPASLKDYKLAAERWLKVLSQLNFLPNFIQVFKNTPMSQINRLLSVYAHKPLLIPVMLNNGNYIRLKKGKAVFN